MCCDLFNMEEKSYPEKLSFFQGRTLFFGGFERKVRESKGSPPKMFSDTAFKKNQINSDVIIILKYEFKFEEL